MTHGISVSDVFLGFRNVPHISIALRHSTPDNTYFIIRATIEHQLPKILSEVKTSGRRGFFSDQCPECTSNTFALFRGCA